LQANTTYAVKIKFKNGCNTAALPLKVAPPASRFRLANFEGGSAIPYCTSLSNFNKTAGNAWLSY